MQLPHCLKSCATAIFLAALAACSSTGPVPGQLSDARAPAARIDGGNARAPEVSSAGNERAYRQDAARHIYALNGPRIWTGKLPPVLYAVGTLQVRLDADGAVRSLNWLRAPRHAPEAIAEIERIVRAAAPYPRASRLGAVVWTDTWLWDRSGRFQLDTLSEGQLQE